MNPNDDAYFRSRRPPEPLKAQVGDEVAYTRYFLKCIGVVATDPMWRKRGIVTEISGRIAYIQWDDDGEDEVTPVQLTNLAHPGPNLAFNE